MNGRPPVVIAHRGDRSRAPENTLAALGLAQEAGPDFVEVDVHLSADGHLMVIHDRTLDRTTTGRGLVSEHTLGQLRRLDAGSWYGEAFAGEPVPTLSEALEAVASPARLLVELKGEGTGFPVAHLARERGGGSPAFISFRPKELGALMEELPQAELRLLAPQSTFLGPLLAELLQGAEELGCRGLTVSGRDCPAEVVEEVHARGLEVWVGAVNDEVEWTTLIEAGVDGLISDRPGELVRYLRRQGLR